METRLHIDGMTCQNCVRHVQTALAGVPDVAAATVDLETKRARVTWNARKEPGHLFELVEAVRAAGYEARPEKDTSEDERDALAEGTAWNRTLFLGLPVTAALMLAEWGFGLGHQAWYGWAALTLTLPVQVWVGGPFYRNAWRQLHRNRLTMDTLVAVGSSAAFGLSVYGLFRPGLLMHPYFMEAAAILSLVGAGHWLEARIARQANSTLHGLLRLAPETARRLGPHDREDEVPASALAEGDLILLKPGDRLPVDGTLADGHGAFDESLLTGEAEPVEKGPGAPVFAGTLNLSRRLVVRVTGRPGETALARVIATVERAQQSRAAIETLVDRVSNVFVLVVVCLGIITLLGWGMLSAQGWEHAVVTAVAVLVVACPCAMGLATPAALLAASNAGAAKGVLFRDAAALEKCGKIDAVLFDKTGTLTLAVAPVERVELTPGTGPEGLAMDPAEFAALALALSSPSAHPWSRSVAAHFSQAAQIAVEDWREERGAGVAAQYQGRAVRLGSPAWLIADGIAFPDAALPKLDRSLALAVGNGLAGLIVLAKNRTKPEAARVVRELEREGLRVYMVSGDSPAAVQAVAAEIGLSPDHLFAEIRPERKGEIVARLQAEGRKVAFVGDGINDAPALAAADLGIAVVGATDVAREAADVVLLTRDLEAIPDLVGLSAATRRVIAQNLFWAFFYNAAMLPLAMLGWIPPVASALAMGLSDLCVMGNALRLLRWRRRPLPAEAPLPVPRP